MRSALYIDHVYTDTAGTCRGDFMKAALPNADVIALVRDVGPDGEPVQVPNVFWVGQDQVRPN